MVLSREPCQKTIFKSLAGSRTDRRAVGELVEATEHAADGLRMSGGRIERRAAALRLAEQSHSAIIPAELLRLLVDLGMYEFPRFGQVVLVDIFFNLRPATSPP